MVNCGGKHDKGNDIPMKIWNKTHHLTDTNFILNEKSYICTGLLSLSNLMSADREGKT